MASTTFSFEDDDSGSEHEHWPEDFAPAPAVASTGYDTHNGLRMHSYQPAVAPSTVADSLSPPPSPEKSVKPEVLTEIPVQYAYPAPLPVKMSTHAYVPTPALATTVAPSAKGAPPSAKSAAAPKAADPIPNTYTYHPMFDKLAETTNKWQGRTKAEVEEDNQKIAADDKVWEKRKVVPTGLADDQMCWVVEADASYTLRAFAAIKDLTGDWKQDPRYEDSWYFVVEKPEEK